MRVTIIIVLILILAVLGLPFWFGMETEKTYSNVTEDYSKSEHLTILDQTYERGWLNSKAETTFILKNGDNDLIKLHQNDTIYHGPIPLQLLFKGKAGIVPVMAIIDSDVLLIPVKESEYSDFIKEIPPASLVTTLSLGGSGTTDISMPGVQAQSAEGDRTFTWSGLNGVVNFTQDFRQVVSDLESAGIEVDGKDMNVSVSGIKGISNLNYKTEGYKQPTGNADFSIDRIILKSTDAQSGEEEEITIRNVDITGSTEVEAGTMNSTHSLSFGELTVGGGTYGPGGYELAVSNIDTKSWEKIQELVSKNENMEQTEEAREQFMSELMRILPGLVMKSPRIELSNLSLETDKGSLRGNALISVDGSNLDNPELAANPLFLITAVKASAELSVAKPLLDNVITDYKKEELIEDHKKLGEELPSDEELRSLAAEDAKEEIGKLIDQKIVTASGDDYVITASYELGQVTLNGQPLDLDSLLNQ